MPAIVAAALKKIALLLATDKRTWKAVFWIIGIILVLLFLPVIVILALTQQPEQSRIQPDISSYLTGLSPEKMENMQDFQNAGVQIAEAMAAVGMRKDTIKAQLIYISAFETVEEIDFQEYANLFAAAPDDAMLIESVNEKYGSNIVLEDFCRSYTWVLNVTMNEYMFSDPATKNAADLASWAENAYASGWAYSAGSGGQMHEKLHYRTTDVVGLLLGYLQYDPAGKSFRNEPQTLYYTPHKGLDSMPDAAGVGLFDGELFAVYVGGGQVIFPSADCGFVVKEPLENRDWTCWCTFDAVTYPPEVYAALNPTAAEVTDEINEDLEE